MKMLIVVNLISDQILLTFNSGVDEYFAFDMHDQKIKSIGKRGGGGIYSMILCKRNFECKLENDIFSLCETYNALPFQNPFSSASTVTTDSNKLNVEIFSCFIRFITSMESLSKEKSHDEGYQAFNNRI